MIKVILLTLILSCSVFAGNFQAKNDTIPNAEYYIDRQDSISHQLGWSIKKARTQLNNTCAWTVDCEPAREVEEKRVKHEHRSGARWIRSGSSSEK